MLRKHFKVLCHIHQQVHYGPGFQTCLQYKPQTIWGSIACQKEDMLTVKENEAQSPKKFCVIRYTIWYTCKMMNARTTQLRLKYGACSVGTSMDNLDITSDFKLFTHFWAHSDIYYNSEQHIITASVASIYCIFDKRKIFAFDVVTMIIMALSLTNSWNCISSRLFHGHCCNLLVKIHCHESHKVRIGHKF